MQIASRWWGALISDVLDSHNRVAVSFGQLQPFSLTQYMKVQVRLYISTDIALLHGIRPHITSIRPSVCSGLPLPESGTTGTEYNVTL